MGKYRKAKNSLKDYCNNLGMSDNSLDWAVWMQKRGGGENFSKDLKCFFYKKDKLV